MKIIKRIILKEGKAKTFYHQKLEVSTRKDTMNVYQESLTSKKKEALVFHDEEEAQKMAAFLHKAVFAESEVINK